MAEPYPQTLNEKHQQRFLDEFGSNDLAMNPQNNQPMNLPVAIGQNDEDFKHESKETINSVRIEKKGSMDSEADAA